MIISCHVPNLIFQESNCPSGRECKCGVRRSSPHRFYKEDKREKVRGNYQKTEKEILLYDTNCIGFLTIY